MSTHLVKTLAALILTGTVCLYAAAPLLAADIRKDAPVVRGQDDDCDEPRLTCSESLCRKFRLQGIYTYRKCHMRYVRLSYMPPELAPYLAPGPSIVAPTYPMPSPGAAPMYGYPVNYGYGPPPAFGPGPGAYGR